MNGRTIFPRFQVYRDFLDPGLRDALLAWALANEAEFRPALVGRDGSPPNPATRLSKAVSQFGPSRAALRDIAAAAAPGVMRDLGVEPFEIAQIETELVATGDGGFYKRHIDTGVGEQRKTFDRLVSAVYYFHAEPKGFSGGALRLYPMFDRSDDGGFREVQPERNTLVAFPSWAPHEIMPVRCPSGAFRDSRFSVNIWLKRRAKSGDAAGA